MFSLNNKIKSILLKIFVIKNQQTFYLTTIYSSHERFAL